MPVREERILGGVDTLTVDEFRAQRGISDPLLKVDSRCYYWQRS